MKYFIVFILCWLGGAFAGMDATLFFQEMPFIFDDLAHGQSTGHAGSWILFVFLIGWVFGGIGIGYLCDRFGRVKGIAFSIFLFTLATGLSSQSSSLSEMAYYRFISGIGIGGLLVSVSIYFSEYWPNCSKAIAIGALISSYQTGVFFSGFLGTFTDGWRQSLFIGGLPIFLALLIPCLLQEISSCNQSKETFFSWKEYKTPLCIGSVAFGALLVGYWASCAWFPTWVQHVIGDKEAQSFIHRTMIIHGLTATGGCLTAGILANKFGRVLVTAASLLSASLLSSWIFLSIETTQFLLQFQYGAVGLSIGVAQAVLYIYLPELFPFRIRGRAVGICLNTGRILTALVVLIMGSMIGWLGGYQSTLLLFSSIYFVGAIAVLFGTETKV